MSLPPRQRFRAALRPALFLASAMALSGCSQTADLAESHAAAKDSVLPPATISSNLDAAKAARLRGDHAAALKILGQLLLASPDDGRIVGEYGKVLAQQGRAREAVEFLTRATILSPEEWTFASALGVAQDQQGDFDKAADAYEKALKLKPNAPQVLNNYALSRLMAGDAIKAKVLIAMAAHVSNDPKIKANQTMIDAYAVTAPQTAPKPAPSPKVASQTLAPPAAKPAPEKPVLKPAMAQPRKLASDAPKPIQPKGTVPALRLATDVK